MNPPRHLVLGTAGHIDHGKTALVRALTGVDTDRLPAEKKRGITIDLGFAALDLGDDRLSLVDVPGHERFIRNMLAGATGLDLALLVVAADDSVMPQTREHLEILKLLGLSSGVVALTKSDLADPSWRDLVEDEIRSLVAGTFLEGAPIVRTSSVSGEGIDALKAALAGVCRALPEPADLGPFRMAIDRAFPRAGLGTIVTGTVASGGVSVGDELHWMPSARPVKVRGLHRHDRPVDRVGRGMRAAINLTGVHHAEIVRGQELGTPGYLAATRIVTGVISASPEAPRPLRHRARYRLHLGTAEVTATLALLGPNRLAPGESALGQWLLAEPMVGVGGQPFVIREESPPATVGGGRILTTTSRRLRRRDSAAIDRLERLRGGDATERIGAALASFGLASWDALALGREANVPLDRLAPELDDLERSGAIVTLALGPRRTTRVTAEVVAELEDRVVRAVGRLHGASPRQSAIRRSHVLAALPDLPGEALVSALIDRLMTRGVIVGDARSVALRSFEPKLSHSERKLKAELAAAIRDGGFTPPDLADLSARAGGRAAVVPDLLALLVDEGRIQAIGGGLFLDIDAEAAMRRRVADHLSGGEAMTMAVLRDLLGTTRKYAVPIGEYLDRIGFTHREGDVRRLAREPEPSADHG